MFQFVAVRSRVSRFRTILKTAGAALALTSVLAAAPAAHATSVVLLSGTMTNSRNVYISGITGAVRDAPMQFQALYNGKPMTLLAWCVDVYHEITVKDYNPDLQYVDTNALTTDFSPAATALSGDDIFKVGLLATYGDMLFNDVPDPVPAFTEAKPVKAAKIAYPAHATATQKAAVDAQNLANTNAYNSALATYNAHSAAHTAAVATYNAAVANRWTELSAVQGAIWQVVSDRNVTAVGTAAADLAFNVLVDRLSGDHLTDYMLDPYGAAYGPLGHDFTLITPVQQYDSRHRPLALTQSFIFAEVPEPATWAMMVLGVGLAGAMLRRQRREDMATA